MTGLDCNTENGRRFIAEQSESATRFAEAYGYGVIQTADTMPADLDAMFYKDGQLVGIAEIKSREMSMSELEGFGSYLITLEKLMKGAELSRRLSVPYILIVRLLKDDVLFYWRITDGTGQIRCPFDVRSTETKRTCNGGTATRANAYLPFINGKRVP